MQKHKQLDLQDRHQIKALLDAGASQTKIAEIVGVHKSTISRELSRNVATRGRSANRFRPELAQRKTNRTLRQTEVPAFHRNVKAAGQAMAEAGKTLPGD
ncbi:hypothetical protein BH23BAC3_BH23BAC3_18490 [soil metagenome]